ncbi:MAG: DUF721 domain-containing protein [Rhabdaerophilum sp.]
MASAPDKSEPIRKRPRVNRLSALVPEMIEPALRQRGFASTAILSEWREIVGASLSQRTAPLEIRWPKRRAALEESRPKPGRMQEKAEGATLVIACPGAFALDVQMSSNAIIEATNRRLGFRAITKIEIRQGELPKPVASKTAPPLSEAQISDVAAGLGDISDDQLKRALAEFGASIVQKDKRNTRM